MLDGQQLGQRLISNLGITQPEAQEKMLILAQTIVEYFKEHGAIDISGIWIQIDNIAEGNVSRNASKSGKGRIQ